MGRERAAAARTGVDPRGGSIDGWTILRYAQAYDDGGGGVERYLVDLQRALSRSHRIATVQLSLTADPASTGTTVEAIDGSRLVQVRLHAPSRAALDEAPQQAREAPSRPRFVLRLLDALLSSPSMNRAMMRAVSRARRVPVRPGEPTGAGAAVAEVLRRERVNLVVAHVAGGSDVSDVIEAALVGGVPAVLVHHFSNFLLGTLSVRQQVARMSGVGAVSSRGTPRYLTGHLWHLSDGIDTTFFDPDAEPSLARRHEIPCLFAPARVTPEKGQADVVRVAGALRRRGLRAKVVLAGRIDSVRFESELRELARSEGVGADVDLLGPLSPDGVREMYRAATLMLLPTRHVEGLPRSILEAQAMGVPPLAYDAGGIREAIEDGRTGFVVTPGDLEGLARRAEEVLRDPERRRLMGSAARRHAESNFGLAALGARHAAFYRAFGRTFTSP